MICDDKISNTVKNIINSELNDDVIITTKQSKIFNRMKKVKDHEYLIEMDYDNFDENIWLHECMHISQLEDGYPQLIVNIRSESIRRLSERLQDFVLDTYLNNRLFNKYNYKITSESSKYEEYTQQIKKLDRNKSNLTFNILMSIEISYIYFNESEQLAKKLLSQIEKKFSYGASKLFYKIIDITHKYKDDTPENCKKCFDEIISLFNFSDFIKTT